MPGRAQHVGAQDGAVVEQPVHRGGGGVAGALPDRPGGRRVVLGLHRAQPAHHLGGPVERIPRRDAGCAAVGSRCPLSSLLERGRLSPDRPRQSVQPPARAQAGPSETTPEPFARRYQPPAAGDRRSPAPRRAWPGEAACLYVCSSRTTRRARVRRGRGRPAPPPQRPPGRHPARRDPGRAGGRAAPRARGGRPGQDQAAPRSSRRRRSAGPWTASSARSTSSTATRLIRAFSLYFQLVNVAELEHRVQVIRGIQAIPAGGSASPGTFHYLFTPRRPRSRAAGSGCSAALAELDVMPVVTAHPTEAVRRSVLDHVNGVAMALDALDGPPPGHRGMPP